MCARPTRFSTMRTTQEFQFMEIFEDIWTILDRGSGSTFWRCYVSTINSEEIDTPLISEEVGLIGKYYSPSRITCRSYVISWSNHPKCGKGKEIWNNRSKVDVASNHVHCSPVSPLNVLLTVHASMVMQNHTPASPFFVFTEIHHARCNKPFGYLAPCAFACCKCPLRICMLQLLDLKAMYPLAAMRGRSLCRSLGCGHAQRQFWTRTRSQWKLEICPRSQPGFC